MEERVFNTNQTVISGEVVSDPEFSHTINGEDFYIINISVYRKSNYYDMIPLMVSDRLIDVKKGYKGCYISTSGQFRSYHAHEDNRTRLVLSVFARMLTFAGDFQDLQIKNLNHIHLEGYICKPPVYRITPLNREITDIVLAVKRLYSKSDYIPCILWGRNAKFAERLEVGAHILVDGRIQSRKYKKKIREGEYEDRIAYEVSVKTIENIDL